MSPPPPLLLAAGCRASEETVHVSSSPQLLPDDDEDAAGERFLEERDRCRLRPTNRGSLPKIAVLLFHTVFPRADLILTSTATADEDDGEQQEAAASTTGPAFSATNSEDRSRTAAVVASCRIVVIIGLPAPAEREGGDSAGLGRRRLVSVPALLRFIFRISMTGWLAGWLSRFCWISSFS